MICVHFHSIGQCYNGIVPLVFASGPVAFAICVAARCLPEDLFWADEVQPRYDSSKDKTISLVTWQAKSSQLMGSSSLAWKITSFINIELGLVSSDMSSKDLGDLNLVFLNSLLIHIMS